MAASTDIPASQYLDSNTLSGQNEETAPFARVRRDIPSQNPPGVQPPFDFLWGFVK